MANARVTNCHTRYVYGILKPAKQNADHARAVRMELRWKMVLTAAAAAKR